MESALQPVLEVCIQMAKVVQHLHVQRKTVCFVMIQSQERAMNVAMYYLRDTV